MEIRKYPKIKRAVHFILDWLTLLAFVFCVIVGILDTFGVLDHYVSWKPDYPKLILLILGMLGVTLVAQNWLSLRDTERESRIAVQQGDEILNRLASVEELQFPTKLVVHRDEAYGNFFRIIADIPSRSNVDLTHFEKLLGIPYDSGEGAMEKKLISRWKERVKNGDLIVRQIVHVSNRRDLEEVHDRLKLFHRSLNYCLNVLVGMPIVPYLDVIVIRGHWAAIFFSSDPVEPFRDAVAIEFTSLPIVQTLERYFEIWWSKFSMPIKTRDGVQTDTLQRLDRFVPEKGTLAAEYYNELCLLGQKDPSIGQHLEELWGVHCSPGLTPRETGSATKS